MGKTRLNSIKYLSFCTFKPKHAKLCTFFEIHCCHEVICVATSSGQLVSCSVGGQSVSCSVGCSGKGMCHVQS